jgi:ribosome-binding factor A
VESLITIAILLAFVGYLLGSIKIINQGYEGLVERLGRYQRILKPGLNFVFPIIDTILVETSREQILDIAPQLAISKDGIPLEIGVVVFWKILDIKRAYYSIEDLEKALHNIVRSILRAEVGRLNLEEIFVSRNTINQVLLHKLDTVFQTWGSKVVRVDIQDILLAKIVLGDVPDTIEFSFHNGIDWSAFKYSFNLVIENEGIEIEVQGIEDKGNGELVVRVKVPSDTNKAQVYKDFMCNYEVTIQAIETKYQAALQSKDEQITIYRERSADMKEIVSLLASRPVNVHNTAIAEAKTMTNSNDSSQTVNIGGNVTGSTINLGKISAAVTNTINQLPSSSDSAQPGIKELLTQLQAAIEAAQELSPEDKADALEQVKVVAELGQNPQNPEKEGIWRKAVKILKAPIPGLPETATIVKAFGDILPAIAKLLSLTV